MNKKNFLITHRIHKRHKELMKEVNEFKEMLKRLEENKLKKIPTAKK